MSSNLRELDEEIEVQNYRDALLFVEEIAKSSRPVSQRDFCDIQKLVTKGLLRDDQVGCYRSVPVSIVNADSNQIIESLPEPHFVIEAMNELWRWLEDTKNRNPFVRAFAFHYIAVTIHPFVDGNGRSVRLMQHLLLLKSGEKVASFVPSETAIMRTRDSYYLNIRNTKKLGRLERMITYLAKCFYESAVEATQEGRLLLDLNKKLTPKERRDSIAEFAKTTKMFSISDLIKMFPRISRRTIERDLESLIKKELIGVKNRCYFYKNF